MVGAREDRGRPLGGAGTAHQLGGGVVLLQGLARGPLVGDLVEPVAQAFGEAAGVGEDDRRAVRLHQVGDALLHVRPDGGALGAAGGPSVACAAWSVGDGGAAEFAQVLHGDDDGEVEFLAGLRLDDLHLAVRGQEAGDLVHRADGGRQADAAGGARQQFVQPLQGQREVRAALGAGDRVHLVQDHRLHAGQRVPRGGGEHQEQGLGGGDQDVRRAGGQGAALGGGGVAGADADLDLRLGQAEPERLVADAGEGAAEVAFDVDREGLERGDVQDPAALAPVGGGRGGGELVECGEEGGQGLAGAGGRDDEDVRALGEGVPGAGLGRGGGGERPREPGAGRGREAG